MILDAPLAPEADADRRSGPDTQTRLEIIDGDVHPALRSPADLKPYMPARWWEVLATYGTRRRHGMSFEPYPKSAPRACRRRMAVSESCLAACRAFHPPKSSSSVAASRVPMPPKWPWACVQTSP